ncbi:cystatin-like fold lipoprotein [Staphylococcus simiae]|uniref:DUF4467 domain-containing protein n=2 Tax=Staphylococcus simiae TaxID=308354 RepID=G5JKJ6_9STAP|nr:DUF4467 domain-containing protein [Staphylococcus simiae]EHJ07305.1 hypothetical protein SS7213T_10084 [Staphylococcus simiae CCM 7213 = CCUG 51256]PNZ14328.1 cystatin-like fold lipoprotein [Staphylococcus simiae]SNV81120.1 putative lipoprotein [Staphylococcus simiae]
MRKVVITLMLSLIIMAGCGNDKYVKEIDKAVKLQNAKQEQLAKKHNGDEVKHFDKKKANIYVYDKDKCIILAYKPLSNDDEVRYYAYDYSGGKVVSKQHFDSRRYYQQHNPDYQEENMTE